MFVIIGLIIIAVCIISGFVIEHGNPLLFFQPVEMLIILGAAGGSFVISNPLNIIKHTLHALPHMLKGKTYAKKDYIDLLCMMFDILSKMKKDGILSVEADIETPKDSDVFKKYPSVLSNHEALAFMCDNLKVIVGGFVSPVEMENLMDLELETIQVDAMHPAHSISELGDAMPGLGLVAAVLGIVLTMGKLDQPPEVLGESIATALLGTFFGILMAYCVFGPMGINLKHLVEEQMTYMAVMKVTLLSFVKGVAPIMCVEFGRRAVPGDAKPEYKELEEAVRGKK
jgi:chemotaxis protein MotA